MIIKIWLQDNYLKLYLIHDEGKSVVAERFLRTLKNKIYKYMTLVSRNVSIDMLDNIVDKFNKKYQRTINMKPIDVK